MIRELKIEHLSIIEMNYLHVSWNDSKQTRKNPTIVPSPHMVELGPTPV
jgi:hypothetical protein